MTSQCSKELELLSNYRKFGLKRRRIDLEQGDFSVCLNDFTLSKEIKVRFSASGVFLGATFNNDEDNPVNVEPEKLTEFLKLL